MKRSIYSILILLAVMVLIPSALLAQMDLLHGTDDESRMGTHSGNQFRTTFFNDGTYGGRVNTSPGDRR